MKQLTSDEYLMLSTTYRDVITLAEHKIVGRGTDILIPIFERITGQVFNINCSDCRLDLVTTLAIAFKNYEEQQNNTAPEEVSITPKESNTNQNVSKAKRNRIKTKPN